MIIAIIVISLLLLFVGFAVTEKNAHFLLNGYNTMSKEEQEQFDLKRFLVFFRNFHIVLAGSFFVISLSVSTLENETLSSAVIPGYPILAYIYMIKKSEDYALSPNTRNENKWGIIALIATLIFVVGMAVFL
jgi:hypothetical protein